LEPHWGRLLELRMFSWDDWDFDREFLIQTDKPNHLRLFMDSSIKSVLYSLNESAYNYSLKFTEQVLSLELSESNASIDQIINTAEKMRRIVETFEAKTSMKEKIILAIHRSVRSSPLRLAAVTLMPKYFSNLKLSDEIVRTIKNNGTPQERFFVAQVLAEDQDSWFQSAFRKGDNGLKVEVMHYLGSTSNPAVYKLATPLLYEAGLSGEVAKYFSKLHDKSSFEELEKVFADGNSSEPELIAALGKRGNLATITLLYKAKNIRNRGKIDSAIAMIQDRIGVKDQGLLSIEESDLTGGLSEESEI
jgi:hypothetical protein